MIVRRLSIIVFLTALVVPGGGCGLLDITLTADRTTISAGGNDYATLTASVMRGDEAAESGLKVTFNTTAGSFSASDTTATYQEVSTNAEGKATVKLYSSATQGAANVDASYYDDASGETYTDSLSITFGAPSGKNNPVDGKFRLSCDAVNIAALRTPTPDIKVTCAITAVNREGTTIPSKSFNPAFLLEAGTITETNDYYSGKKVYLYSPKGGNPTPKDVARDSGLGEPGYQDKNGLSRNPRDGLVTIVAYMDGEEAFTDVNGNGKHDSTEPFIDAPEPFLDEDDDDTKDPAEPYKDVNGNGKWDKANGKWDSSVKIMAIYKILWTGPVDSSTRTSRLTTSSGSTAIDDGGQLDIQAYLLDANMNPVAAYAGNSDYLEWALNAGSSDAYSADSTSVTLKNLLGFSFNTTASNERKRWQMIPNSFTTPKYTFTVTDYYPKDGKTSPQNFTVGVKAYLTPGPQESGYYVTQVTDTITDKLSGTCD